MWAGGLMAYGIVITYVAISGVRGAAWSDVLQGTLMIVIAWGLGLYIVYHLYGSPTTMFESINATHPGHLVIGKEGSHMGAMTYSTLVILSSLGGMMWPHLFMKAYVAEEKTIKKSILLFPVLGIFLIPVFFIGFAGILKVPASELGAADQILPYMIYNVLKLSPLIIGLVGAGALAASMSSADAITHGAGTVFVQDILRAISPKMSEKSVGWAMRLMIVVIGAIAYGLTFGRATLVGLLIGGYGYIVQIAPLVYGALYWSRATKEGAISGFVVGTLVNSYYVFSKTATPFGINSGIVGLIVNIVVFVVVSLLTKPQSKEHIEKFVGA
jgi:SSS family solute:Na+ symporter